MTVEDEILEPFKNFWSKYSWLILLVSGLLIMAYCSVIFLGKNNEIELEIEKVIEVETGVKLDLTP